MKLVEPTPLHPGVRPLPERGSRPAIKDDVAAPTDAAEAAEDAAIISSNSGAAPATDLSALESQTVPDDAPTSETLLAIASREEATAEADSSEEQPRKRHDKRRRRPRRSGKRRGKSGGGQGDGASDGGNTGGDAS